MRGGVEIERRQRQRSAVPCTCTGASSGEETLHARHRARTATAGGPAVHTSEERGFILPPL